MARLGAEGRTPSVALAGWSQRATGFGQSEPVASAERDERHPEPGSIDTRSEDDGDGQAPPPAAWLIQRGFRSCEQG